MRIATFNVQNLRLRRQDGAPHLDGARDGDIPEDTSPAAAAHDPTDRQLTAAVLRLASADIVALQEVFDRASLDYFHESVLAPMGVRPYPHRYCLPGNDGRGLDVALMSRRRPTRVESHAPATPAALGLAAIPGCEPEHRIFRRDCLEAEIGALTLFVCHFKAPYPDAEAAWPIRQLEAAAVAALIRRRFPNPAEGLWLVLGDLNEPFEQGAAGSALAPLIAAHGVDLMLRLPEAERWSFHQPYSTRYARPDAMIASAALASRFPEAAPTIIRAGLDFGAARYRGPRFEGVGRHRPHASDHAAIVIELPGL